MVAFYNNKFQIRYCSKCFGNGPEMITEGLRPDDLSAGAWENFFEEALMNGMSFALGDYDLNEDGIMDVCFIKARGPLPPKQPCLWTFQHRALATASCRTATRENHLESR